MDDALTRDTFYHGRVVVSQLKKGYRFAVDAPILADFLPFNPGEPALEIGCGCGIISLLALSQHKFSLVTAVEIQAPLCRLARQNAAANNLAERLQVIEGDFRDGRLEPGAFPVIFSNPPFHPLGRGRLSRSAEIGAAKFEVSLSAVDILVHSRQLLTGGGAIFLIYPFARRDELLAAAAGQGYHAALIRSVHPFASSQADRFLIKLVLRPTATITLPPLVIFKDKGEYSTEMEKVLAGTNA